MKENENESGKENRRRNWECLREEDDFEEGTLKTFYIKRSKASDRKDIRVSAVKIKKGMELYSDRNSVSDDFPD
jgi:hypothetical protein